MTRFDEATERFNQALVRLEAAARAVTARSGDVRIHGKLTEGLTEALQATQNEYAALREATRVVSGRLDATIDRLRNVLES